LHLLPEGRILNTSIAVVAGLTYNFLPFMLLPLFAAIDKIDPRLVEAAGDLYASPFTAFRKVTWPLSMPGVVAGTLLTFIPASGDYINAQLLGSPNDRMIGNVIQANFIQFRDYPTASALSFALMGIILILVFSYIRRAGTEELV
jgi:spermidine/putrescine transport system permease protein